MIEDGNSLVIGNVFRAIKLVKSVVENCTESLVFVSKGGIFGSHGETWETYDNGCNNNGNVHFNTTYLGQPVLADYHCVKYVKMQVFTDPYTVEYG